jgi:predicted dinucleotide-utilizing enzyme
MRYYSDTEVREMVEELTETAEEAIEAASAEAARAAALASLDREAAVLREVQRVRAEHGALQSKTVRTAVITGAVCFLSGFVIGAVVIR